MPAWWAFLATGVLAGIASGLFGIGGGLIIIPVLVFAFGMDQHAASGTSLVALLLPVGAFAVWNYFQAGKIGISHIQSGLWLAVGLAVGAFFGSRLAIGMNPQTLRRVFAVFMILTGVRMVIL